MTHHIIGIVGIAHRIRGTQQHLEEDVRNTFAQLGQTLPRIFLQKTHSDIKGRATPALHRKKIRQHARVIRCDGSHICGTHARRKQRLMGITHRGVRQQYRLLLKHPLCKFLCAQFPQPVAGARWHRGNPARLGQERHRKNAICPFASLHLGIAIDDNIANKSQQAGCAIGAFGKLKQLGCRINKTCRAFTGDELRMINHVFQKL